MKNSPITLLIILFVLSACQHNERQTPVNVEIMKQEGKYQLLVNGAPFQVKGAGINFADGGNFKALAEAGGNSFRTWRTDSLTQELDSAKKYNLMMAVGLYMEKEMEGFDYEDESLVAEQFEKFKAIVDQYKSHPNILCWVVGNELNLFLDENGGLKLVNPKVYVALADLVDYIHKVDPYHPVTTAFAGIIEQHLDTALKYCPNLDFISVQVYKDLQNISNYTTQGILDMPFMVTEFGPEGHWERPTTVWGREIEEPSAAKASSLAARIRKGIVEDMSGLNIGNFAFEWGQKQERTPTWYGMFNKTGEATARIDELTKYWTGNYPENRAPMTDSLKINGQHAVENIYLKPLDENEAIVYVREVDEDPIDYKWVIMKEVIERSSGGLFEQEPAIVDFEILSNEEGKLLFIAPKDTGEYRLFSYAYDGRGKVGNANVPFYVR